MLGSWLALGPAGRALAFSNDGGVMVGGRPNAPYGLDLADNHILSSCLQCNTGCGIRAKLQDGVVTKIDGNPYSPWTLLPHLPYATGVDDAAPVDGALCPKGQSGLQTAYDPYRIRKVLKRAGKRGENRWRTISFEQAIREIVEGGRVFAEVEGEEQRDVEGLRALLALRDPEVAAAMASDVQTIWDEKDPASKASLVEQFRRTHAEHLDVLIDPEHPDLGPKNNQLVLSWGRLKDGRGDLYKRFAKAFGSVNAHGHTTVCQGSLYFTGKAISEQYVHGKFSDGKKFYWQADTENSRFILFVGANIFAANYGPPNRTVRLTDNLINGRTRIAVADPRFSTAASKAWRWLPVQPGTDGALAMGFIRWMLDEGRYDADFLTSANPAAASASGETSWTNASLLVSVVDGEPGSLVRAADVTVDGRPLAAAERRSYSDPDSGETREYEERFFVAMVGGRPTPVDINDTDVPVFGDLFVDTTLPDGTRVKSGLQVLLETSQEHSVAGWAELAGIDEDQLVEVARELTSHGKAAAVDIHRGVSQHTNGFYNVLGWMTV
ncbi:MAG: molybdopterin-dependent oxidoreductase, partial [Nitriliruptoraceae bacterium]